MKRIILAATALTLVFGAAAQAAPKSKEEVLADWEATGEVKRCVSLTQIDGTDVLDDQTILFRTKNRDRAYLNELPNRCPQLDSYRAFGYKVSINQLCDLDIITVIDTSAGQQLASCGLGKFQEMSHKPEMDDAE